VGQEKAGDGGWTGEAKSVNRWCPVAALWGAKADVIISEEFNKKRGTRGRRPCSAGKKVSETSGKRVHAGPRWSNEINGGGGTRKKWN